MTAIEVLTEEERILLEFCEKQRGAGYVNQRAISLEVVLALAGMVRKIIGELEAQNATVDALTEENEAMREAFELLEESDEAEQA